VAVVLEIRTVVEAAVEVPMRYNNLLRYPKVNMYLLL
jgi:hypothetical protein